MVTKKFTIIDMNCVSCSLMIDGSLEDTDGVASSVTNYAKMETVVQFDPKKLSEEEIIAIIAQSGYTAKEEVKN